MKSRAGVIIEGQPLREDLVEFSKHITMLYSCVAMHILFRSEPKRDAKEEST